MNPRQQCMKGNTNGHQHGHASNTHGKSPTYNAWQRLFRADREGEVCARWHHFVNFLSDMGERPSGHKKVWLLRRDYTKPWQPGNVFWSTTRRGMARTKETRSRQYMWDGKMRSLTDLVHEHMPDPGVPLSIVIKRMDEYGWDLYRALLKPFEKRPKQKYYDYNGKRISLLQAAKISGHPYRTIVNRVTALNWTITQAIERPKGYSDTRKAHGVKQETERTGNDQSDGGMLLLPRAEGRLREEGGGVLDPRPDVRADGASGESLHEELDPEGARC